jgi:hypothetical protein
MKVYSLIYIILLYLVTGCGGIRGSGGTIDEEPTTKTNKIFKGKVNQVDTVSQEITINGVKIALNGAQIYRNSTLIENGGLRVGQIASVETGISKKGKISAVKIEIEDQLQGPIEAIDLEESLITVLGQKVHISSSSSFTQKSLKTLKINFYIAIFGFRDENGVLEATLVEFLGDNFQASIDTVKISGEVSIVDNEKGLIFVEGIEIKVGENEIQTIKVGDNLSFNGLTMSQQNPAILQTAESITRIQVEVKNYDLNREIALEGLPIKIVARNMFTLNGYQIVVPMELMDAEKINSVVDRKIIVGGVFVGEKEVRADSIRVEQIKDFEYRGVLKTTRVENEISIFNKTILINIYTSIDFNLNQIVDDTNKGLISQVVYAKGYVNSEGKMVATVVSANPDEKEQYEFIKGKIENIEDEVITISGIPIQLNNFIIYLNEDRKVNVADLFTLVAIGDRVEVFGGFNSEGSFFSYFLRKKGSIELPDDKPQSLPLFLDRQSLEK